MLRIWKEPVKNPAASERAGRPIFDEATYVEVISPGSPGSSPVFEVERLYHESVDLPPYRSPQYSTYEGQIKAFNDGTEAAGMTGTPLTEWPEMTRTMAASLNASGVYSIEALAALPDTRLAIVGPDGRTWRTKAVAYLESTLDSGAATRYAAELERSREEVARLREELATMAQTVTALTTDKGSQDPATASLTAPTAPGAPLPPADAFAAPATAQAAPGETLVAAPASPGGSII